MKQLPTFTAGEFRKASRSSPDQNCVRIARRDGWTAVWDDKLGGSDIHADTPLPGNEILLFADDQFDTYQAGVRQGRTTGLCLSAERDPDGMYVFRAAEPAGQPIQGVALRFDQAEIDAFYSGIRSHEFDRTQFAAA